MKENFFLISGFIYISIIFYLLDFWNTDLEAIFSTSESHARSRYAVAEKIQKEFIR